MDLNTHRNVNIACVVKKNIHPVSLFCLSLLEAELIVVPECNELSLSDNNMPIRMKTRSLDISWYLYQLESNTFLHMFEFSW